MWLRGKSKKEDQERPTIKESDRWIEGYERVTQEYSDIRWFLRAKIRW